jgi:two-component system sensor histidine kinase NreB
VFTFTVLHCIMDNRKEDNGTEELMADTKLVVVKDLKLHPMRSDISADDIVRSLPDSYLVINSKGKILRDFIREQEKLICKNEANPNRKSVQTFLKGSVARKIKEQLDFLSIEKRLVSFELNLDSTQKSSWFEIRIFHIAEDAIFVNIRNVTELLSKANALEKFYNITEQSHELVMVTDVTGTIEYINPMVTKVTGYSFNELIGKNAAIFKSGKHDAAFYFKMWSSILKGKSFKGEFHNIKKSGEHYIEEKIITPLNNINGQITNFISTGRDVTLERKRELKAYKYKQLQVTMDEKAQKSQTLSLIKSNETERKKFAREIHEGLNQMLSAAMANLESLSAKNVISTNEKSKIELINQMVSEIIQELRGISTDLSPISLYEFGMWPVLQQLINRTNKFNRELLVTFSSNIKDLRFKNEIEINIYRIIKEAIDNAIKHAGAKKITLSLNYANNTLALKIKDDGKGINMNTLKFKKMSTFGILNIEARARSIGAALNITSRKDKGFVIDLSLNTKTTKS